MGSAPIIRRGACGGWRWRFRIPSPNIKATSPSPTAAAEIIRCSTWPKITTGRTRKLGGLGTGPHAPVYVHSDRGFVLRAAAFRRSCIGSPLPLSAYIPQQDGGGVAGEIFRSDVTGDGTVGDLLPGTILGNTGKYSTSKLTKAIALLQHQLCRAVDAGGQCAGSRGLFSHGPTAKAGSLRAVCSDPPTGLPGHCVCASDLAEDDGSAVEPSIPGGRAGEVGAEHLHI